MTIRWYGLVAPEDVPTGDRRMIAAQALDYRPFPLPAMWQRAAVGGHDAAVVVASWDRWYAAEGGVWAEGVFLDPTIVPEVVEAIYLLDKKLIGPSVDLDSDLTYEVVEHPTIEGEYTLKITKARVHGVTFVMAPAFPQVHITVDNDEEYALLASAGINTFVVNKSAWRSWPVAGREVSFNFQEAVNRIAEWSGGDAAKFGSAFLYRDKNMPPNNRESYKLPIADIINGKITLIPRAVMSAATILSGAHGGLPEVPDADKIDLQKVVTEIYDTLNETYGDPRFKPPWQRGGRDGATSSDDTPTGTASLLPSDMDIMSTCLESRANPSPVLIAPGTSIDEAPRPGGSAEAALTNASDMECSCRTSSVLTVRKLSNLSGDFETKSGVTDANSGETGISPMKTTGRDGQPTPTMDVGMRSFEVPGHVHRQAGARNAPPTGETSSEFQNFNGSTLKPSLLDSGGVAKSATSPSNFDQASLEQSTLPTSTTVITPVASEVSSVRRATEDLEPSVMMPTSSSVRPTIFTNTRQASTSPKLLSPSSPSAVVDVPVRPDRSVFNNPKLKQATKLKVTEDGRVFGTLAAWRQCHLGIGNRCVMAPKSATNYQIAKTGQVLCADGKLLDVGKITLGTGHANDTYGVIPAVEHYDNTGTCVAIVNFGEDDFGIWFAGTLVPGVTEEKAAELRRSPLSGDWRRVKGNLELVAALAVNDPGFPILTEDEDGAFSLVAAGMVIEDEEEASAVERDFGIFSSIDEFLESQARAERRRLFEATALEEECNCVRVQ